MFYISTKLYVGDSAPLHMWIKGFTVEKRFARGIKTGSSIGVEGCGYMHAYIEYYY
jgi:hypothetical protein